MPREYLAYWKPRTADDQLAIGGPLRHAASNQFGRIEKGDTVWIVTVREGRLHLVAQVVVERVTGQSGAARVLDCNEADLWSAAYHIIGEPGTELPLLDVDIQSLAQSLRFDSASGNNRLRIGEDGLTSAQQLQTMRLLTAASAEALSRVVDDGG